MWVTLLDRCDGQRIARCIGWEVSSISIAIHSTISPPRATGSRQASSHPPCNRESQWRASNSTKGQREMRQDQDQSVASDSEALAERKEKLDMTTWIQSLMRSMTF